MHRCDWLRVAEKGVGINTKTNQNTNTTRIEGKHRERGKVSREDDRGRNI